MAPFTIKPESAPVDIVLIMTAGTGLRGFKLFLHRFCMARETVDILVLTVKFVLRILIMVESPDPPAVRVVACPALWTKLTLVLVVRLMARVTLSLGLLI